MRLPKKTSATNKNTYESRNRVDFPLAQEMSAGLYLTISKTEISHYFFTMHPSFATKFIDDFCPIVLTFQ